MTDNVPKRLPPWRGRFRRCFHLVPLNPTQPPMNAASTDPSPPVTPKNPSHPLGALLGDACPSALADVPITGLTDDSRAVQAADRGARVLLVGANTPGVALPGDAPGVARLNEPIDQALAGNLAERFYGNPAQKLTAIGITGTNGKTSTALLTQHLLKRAGMTVGLIGTIWTDDGQTRTPAELTTPGAIDLSRLLAQMVAHGCTHVVMETSSHALHQGRVDHLNFGVGVFTNLTGDHLDYHGTMDAYADAKAKLFAMLPRDGVAVVNADDPHTPRMIRDCEATVIDCSVGRSDAAYCIEPMELTARGSVARLHSPRGELVANIPLVGRHNLQNLVHAVACAGAVLEQDVLEDLLPRVLPGVPAAPGRLEQVTATWPEVQEENQGTTPGAGVPAVVVDYAHTDDALANVLRAVREVLMPGTRLAVVFGCGGDRDATKRPRMARVAYELADVIHITSDNPRTEDPQAILDDIVSASPPPPLVDH